MIHSPVGRADAKGERRQIRPQAETHRPSAAGSAQADRGRRDRRGERCRVIPDGAFTGPDLTPARRLLPNARPHTAPFAAFAIWRSGMRAYTPGVTPISRDRQ